jgi:hypothetical protein
MEKFPHWETFKHVVKYKHFAEKPIQCQASLFHHAGVRVEDNAFARKGDAGNQQWKQNLQLHRPELSTQRTENNNHTYLGIQFMKFPISSNHNPPSFDGNSPLVCNLQDVYLHTDNENWGTNRMKNYRTIP